MGIGAGSAESDVGSGIGWNAIVAGKLGGSENGSTPAVVGIVDGPTAGSGGGCAAGAVLRAAVVDDVAFFVALPLPFRLAFLAFGGSGASSRHRWPMSRLTQR